MDVSPELIQLGANLTESMARNGAAMITNRIRALKTAGRSEETIASLEEVINELLHDKAEIASIAQSYRAQLVSQQLASGDVKYIADTLFPLFEQLADASPDAEQKREQLEVMKPLLSVETANVLQLLGFNFRKAIGEPLTSLCESLILTSVKKSDDVQL